MFDSHLVYEGGDLEIAWINLILSGFVLILGFISYLGLRKRGEVWSLFHGFWFFSLVIPICITGLYASSLRNKDTIGSVIEGLQPWVDLAFFISCIGSLAVFAGHYVALSIGRKRPLLWRKLNWLNWNFDVFSGNKVVLIGILFVALSFMGCLVLVFGVETILSLNLRGAFLGYEGNAVLRPVYNFLFAGLVPFAFLLVTLALRRYSNVLPYLGLGILLIVGVFAGTRGAVLWPIVVGISLWIIAARSRLVMLVGIILAPVLLFMAVYLGHIRSGETSVYNAAEGAVDNLKYGNEFSDVRDLGWILSGWDGEYRLGRTYVAASLSFVPSEYLPWRRYNGMVWQMTGPLGLLDGGHAGLRPGVFGEAYLNFGFVGVILMGLFLGYLITRLDLNLLFVRNNIGSRLNYMCAAHFLFTLLSMFSNTAGFFTFYCLLVCFVACYVSCRFMGINYPYGTLLNGTAVRGKSVGRTAT
jgi:oligosaccharide repeat unit polymerase